MVDTRTKILSPAEAAGLGPAVVVTGCFDPLLAGHARRMAELARAGAALVVVLLDPQRPLLPARARAELAASLAAVNWVVLPGAEDPGQVIRLLKPLAVYREETAERERTQALIQRVWERRAG